MSVGDLITSGGKGTNHPWQLKMLRGIQAILDTQEGDDTILTQIKNILEGTALIDGYNYVGPENTGDTAGFEAYSIQNVGMTNALIDGQTFPPGSIIEYSGEKGDTHSGKTYDTQDTTLIITTVLR
jgi:hypothetical protein